MRENFLGKKGQVDAYKKREGREGGDVRTLIKFFAASSRRI